MVTDTQVRKLMKEYEKNQNLRRAAMKADMDRKTARKYLDADKLPSETKKSRHWRTRKDPFRDDWPDIEAKLEDAPELGAKTLFDDLRRRRPGKYTDGQLRTMQRRVKKWQCWQCGAMRTGGNAGQCGPGAMRTGGNADRGQCGAMRTEVCTSAQQHGLIQHSTLYKTTHVSGTFLPIRTNPDAKYFPSRR